MVSWPCTPSMRPPPRRSPGGLAPGCRMALFHWGPSRASRCWVRFEAGRCWSAGATGRSGPRSTLMSILTARSGDRSRRSGVRHFPPVPGRSGRADCGRSPPLARRWRLRWPMLPRLSGKGGSRVHWLATRSAGRAFAARSAAGSIVFHSIRHPIDDGRSSPLGTLMTQPPRPVDLHWTGSSSMPARRPSSTPRSTRARRPTRTRPMAICKGRRRRSSRAIGGPTTGRARPTPGPRSAT